MKLLFTLIAFSQLSMLAFCQDYQLKTYENDLLNVKEYTLANGLKVYLSENHDKPQVYGMVTVRAGGKNDPIHATGMAHYLEHMLFKGTETMGTIDYQKEKPFLDSIVSLYDQLGKTTDEEERLEIQKQINQQALEAGKYAIPNEMDRMLKEIGSTGVNAFTSEDITSYHNTFPSSQIDKWLSIYDTRFEKPVFRLFQSELETVYEEKNRSADDPFSGLFEAFLKKMFKNHPYGQQPLIGFTEHLKNPSLTSMYEYFDNYYVANNMALIMAGDFDSDELIVKINNYFGDWRTGEVPEFKEVEELPFNGVERHDVKLTPVKVGVRGYRTPKNGAGDQLALQLANSLITNNEGTGVLDNLVTQGKLLFTGMMPLDYNDHGASILFFVPKIIGQNFDEAEAYVDDALDKLKSGELEDRFFNAAKLSMRKAKEQQLESNTGRVMLMMNAFGQKIEWSEYLKNEQHIADITKEEVVAVMKKYYGDDYLAMYSKMGKRKKDKLNKPEFEPVIPKDGVQSSFYTSWQKIPESEVTPKFVDFKKDLSRTNLNDLVHLACVENPFNDWFELNVSWGKGKYYDSLLLYAPDYLLKVGIGELEGTDFSRKLFELGASFNVWVEDDKLHLKVFGIDQNIVETMQSVNDLLTNFKADDDVMKMVLNEVKGAKKLSYDDPSELLSALREFAMKGQESSNLKELKLRELLKVSGEDMTKAIREAFTHELSINYSGRLKIDSVADILNNNLDFSGVTKPKLPPVMILNNSFKQPEVYFLHEKSAVQTQLMFLSKGKPVDLAKHATVDGFNMYFGGDMSSLVFQEIREFRSLAYSTRARVKLGKEKNDPSLFWAYIGCQGDKTPEALDVMYNLIKEMPLKRDREESILKALKSEAKSARPGFRSLANSVQYWENQGYQDDPNKIKLKGYESLTFDDIVSFYEDDIKSKNLVLIVVGNKRKFNTKELKKYGELKVVKKRQILKK